MGPLLLALLLLLAIATLLYQGVAIVLAFQMVRVDPPTRPLGRSDRVAIVIAARNEAEEIGGCLEALARSTLRPEEVVVVDGGSTDGTPEIVGKHPGVRLVPEPPLPEGWVGKNWACHLGAEATRAPNLLFLDADVRLHPEAIAAAAEWAERDGADLVSFASRIEMSGLWERIVMPLYTQLTLTYFRAPRTNRPDSRVAVANGQFLWIRRPAYDTLGGHAAVAPIVLEDVALARRFRAAGRTLRFGWAPELVRTRMYRDRREMFEGILKTAHDTEFSAARQVVFLLGMFLFFLAPLAILPIGLLDGSFLLTAVGAFVAFALFAKHVAFSKAVGGRARDGLLYPVAVGFYLAVLARSLSEGLRGRPTVWKGRSYALERAAAPPGTPPSQ